MTDSPGKFVTIAEDTPLHALPRIPYEDRGPTCQGCIFGGYTVGSRGPEDSPFVIVGESPGSNELYQGYPFVGESGIMLKDALERVGLTAEDPAPYIINTIQCFPREKSQERMQVAARCCGQRIHNLIRKHPRKVILALGAAASWVLTDNYGLKITQERGKRFKYAGSEFGVVVTLHPAYLMRQGTAYGPWKRDLSYAVSLLKGTDPKDGQWVEPTWGVIETDEQLADLVERYSKAKYIAADTETGGRDELGFPAGLHFQKGSIISLSVTSDLSNGRHVDIIPATTIWRNEELMRQFMGNSARWIWQNGKFDIKFFRYEGITTARVDEDTMLLSYCLVPETRVLKRDLTWDTMENLKVGDELIGFQEWNETRSGPTSIMEPTTVTALNRLKASCYKITTEHGSVICSENHMWVTRRFNQRPRRWTSTKELAQSKGAAELSLFVNPWEPETDHDAGYIAGILDGEGHLSITQPKGPNGTCVSKGYSVGFSQKPGYVLDRALKILDTKGYNYRLSNSTRDVVQVHFQGDKAGLRALGAFRPSRLLAKAEQIWAGHKKAKPSKILSIEYVGEREVIGIETTSKTLIAEGFMSHNCLNENKGHDLDTIAWDWIGAPQHKNAVEDWFKHHRIARSKRDYAMLPRMTLLYPYQAYDTSKTYKMFFPLREAVNLDEHSKKLYENILIPASEFLAKVEMKGLMLDPERIRENDQYLWSQLQEVEADIQVYARKYLGMEINIGSHIQLKRLLYSAMKLGHTEMSTDEDSLIKVQRQHDHPIIPRLMKWRTLSKARNTYVKSALGTDKSPPWTGPDGRVHITFKIHGTSTGRLSSGDPTNLQNWPRDPQIRGAFIAAPNHTLIEQDLNQAELRCLAIMSGDPTLVEIYRLNEVSIHHVTSVAMFGEHYDDDQKMRAKAVNFGIVYGRTAPSLAEEFNIPLKEAEEYIRIWLDRYPVARDFIQSCRTAPSQMRTMITVFGRKKRWGVISDQNQRNSENEAANFPHQSSAHDVTLLAGIECQPVVKAIWDIDFVNEIHDALYTEALADPAIYRPATAYVTSVMQRIPRDYGLGVKTGVPFITEAKQGTRWGRSYMEGFQPTEDDFEEAERLVSNHLGRIVRLRQANQ